MEIGLTMNLHRHHLWVIERVEHGGMLNLGKRKTRRPFAANRPIHYVMRSEMAVGKFSLHRHSKTISELLKKQALKFGVKLYTFSVNSTHIHLILSSYQRVPLQNFTRTVMGLIARLVTGACRNRKFSGRFWSYLVYSRLGNWGRQFQTLLKYVHQNQLETLGLIPYTPRSLRTSFVPRRV